MSKKLNLYFYEKTTGTYDEYSPAYVCGIKNVPEVLYLIGYYEPFSLGKDEIVKELKIKKEELDIIIDSLKRINAIDIKDDKYKLNFTVFLERDMPLLDKYFLSVGEVVGKKIIAKKEEIYREVSKISAHSQFSKERLLYHIICDGIFDGTAFEFFRERGILNDSKKQPENRDYMIFGYENSENVEKHSDILLCSSNNYCSNDFRFNSFGDSNGSRKDMYRYFRKVHEALKGATVFNELNLAYIKLIDNRNREILQKCGQLIWKAYKNKLYFNELSLQEKDLLNFLIEFEYLTTRKVNHQTSLIGGNLLNLQTSEKVKYPSDVVNNDLISCIVPVFEANDNEIITEISNIILNSICKTVKDVFDEFEKKAIDITAIKHKISMTEIAIELWHQVFGFTNEYLAKVGFVQAPEHKQGEGRYLRSFWKLS